MNETRPGYTVVEGVTHWDAEARQREARASRRIVIDLAVAIALALGISAWLIVSTGVAEVSAAAEATETGVPPPVPYLPSLYVNQATEVVPPPATF